MKALGWIAIGLAAGFALSMLLPSKPARAPLDASPPTTGAGTTPAAPASEYDSLRDRLAALETSVDTLAGALESYRARSSQIEARETELPAAVLRLAELRQLERNATVQSAAAESPELTNLTQRLMVNGFTPERIEWIDRRREDLVLDLMQARYQAQRNGEPAPSDSDVDRRLRQEMGDFEYERYLSALGRATTVGVLNVLANSPAENAGMINGDRIVSYAGTRVFVEQDLNSLILDGMPGEPVVVEIERGGQRMQLVLPRGPLGIRHDATGALIRVPQP